MNILSPSSFTRIRAIGSLWVSLSLGACSLWPSVPETVAAPPDAPSNWATPLSDSDTDTGIELENWVDQFSSSLLSKWVDEAIESNLDMAAASARFTEAHQTAKARFGPRLPNLELQFAPFHQDLLTPTGSVSPSSSVWGLISNWEIDLWGRVSSQSKAAKAQYVASTADLMGARLSVTAGVISGWARLSGATERLHLAQKELRIRTLALELTDRRFKAGLASSLDIRLARSAEAGAQAGIAAAKRDLAEITRDLEVVLGRYPSGALQVGALPKTLPPIAEIASPMELLSRRPDIGAAEARLEAVGFQAKSARAALWPVLNLRLRLGSADTWAQAFDPKLFAADLLLSLVAPIFRGGTLRAESKAAVARAEAAAAGYAQTILNAWREVEDARSAEVLLMREETARAEASKQAIEAENLAEQQYRQGVISIFNLIDAQTRSISANNALISARMSRVLNRVSYHRALGGAQPITDGPSG